MAYLCSHHAQSSQKKKNRCKYTLIRTLRWWRRSPRQRELVRRRRPLLLSEGKGESKRTCSTDGRQSRIRDGIDSAAITRLWQIYRLALSELGPFTQMKPELQLHPSRSRGLDQYANVSFQLLSPTLIQPAFSQEHPRLLQNYQRIKSVENSSVWDIMHTCMASEHVQAECESVQASV